jgi:hypothetical protein
MIVKSREDMLKNHSFTLGSGFNDYNHDEYDVLYNDKQIGSFNPYHGYINLFALNGELMPERLTLTHIKQLSDFFKIEPAT